VDAAYAGSAWVYPELGAAAAGGKRAGSHDAKSHRWMLTGMGCSCLLTGRVDDFRRAVGLAPEYLQSAEDVISLSELSIPLGRPFRALRLWAVLRGSGRSGLQAMIREHVRLAEVFEAWVRDEPGWQL